MNLAENFAAIRSRIAAACARAGREVSTVQLVAVSKTHPAATVTEAVQLGQLLFGESKVQETKAKIPECPSAARWHLIGHLQTNKAREAVQWFDMIESVDSLHLAQELNRRADAASKRLAVLLQVNVAGESTKFGYSPERFLEELPALAALPRLEVQGVMTIAPYAEDPERVRPVFRRLRELKQQAEARLGFALPHLSMGMSGDFEVAIEEGATLVRVGTALFGTRPRAEVPAVEGT